MSEVIELNVNTKLLPFAKVKLFFMLLLPKIIKKVNIAKVKIGNGKWEIISIKSEQIL